MKKSPLLLSALLVFSGAATAASGAGSGGLQRAGGPPPPRGADHFHHPGHRPAPVYHGGFHARHWHPYWARHYPGYYWETGYWGPAHDISVVYGASNSSPDNDGACTAAGAVIGGVAGAIIGNNSGSHRNGWNSWSGAAVGASLGALAGSIADHNAARDRRQEAARRQAVQQQQQLAAQQIQQAERARQTAPEAGQTPQNVTIDSHPNGGADSMRPANSLFGR
ncbi:MAG: glycine zipper 2TM domain-containing protein [Opitutaceae bacterium]|nr:glycine zipper 2TM domain-containing protein [Opitutaceae bacterium]